MLPHQPMTRIAIVGEFDPQKSTHVATEAALAHAREHLHADVQAQWIRTDALDAGVAERFSGFLIAPGSPYADAEKTLAVIRFAREHGVPCLGTCGGFQHMVIEYARHVLGIADAQHAEYADITGQGFITALECSLAGRSMTLTLTPDSHIAAIYGNTRATEQYYCNFGVAPERVPLLKSGPLRVTGSDAEGEVRVIELPGHPFFIGTLFVPQQRSAPGKPHPLLTAFVRAACGLSL